MVFFCLELLLCSRMCPDQVFYAFFFQCEGQICRSGVVELFNVPSLCLYLDDREIYAINTKHDLIISSEF